MKNTIPHRFTQYKPRLDASILEEITRMKETYGSISPWVHDVSARFLDFVPSGKSIRGSFVYWVTEALGGQIFPVHDRIATALELFHSGLLIHDDIMDNDRLRRGKPSIFAAYEQQGLSLGVSHANEYGISLGICAGDIALFFGYEILAHTFRELKGGAVLNTLSSELLSVCFAQMGDVSLGYANHMPSKNDIMNIYRYKTARYTFSLPFAIGAALQGVDDEMRSRLISLGEEIGMVFQITDDLLNVFGSPEFSGKPRGSDIRDRKKTYLMLTLYELMSPEERERYFSSTISSDSYIKEMYSLMEKYALREYIQSDIVSRINNIYSIIDTVELADAYTQDLREFTTFLSGRIA